MALHFDNVAHFRAFKLGRMHYLRQRQRQAAERRRRLVDLVASGDYRPTNNRALAAALGVSRRTVARDLRAIRDEAGRCTHCGQLLPAVVEGLGR